MKLVHHTTKYALESIIKDKAIYPVYDCVWMTTSEEGEATAGMTMPNEHKARVVVKIPDNKVLKFNDIHEDFPHLNVGLLNMISNTDLWYLTWYKIPDEFFMSTDVMDEESNWIPYIKPKKEKSNE